MSDRVSAYIAGYTDAEGCIGVYLDNSTSVWHAQVSFHQTRPAVIDSLLLPTYGGSKYGETPKRGRPIWKYQIQAIDDVRRFLADVLPYLREKREQAELVLNDFDPKADYNTNLVLADKLSRLKDKRLEPVVLTSRLAIAPRDPDRKCFDCGEPAFARGFCAKHYQKARREGRIKALAPKGQGVPFTYGRELAPLDAPYFAGYFDGDGCLDLRPEKQRWYPRVAFGQTQPDVVIDLRVIYGGSLTFQTAKKKSTKPSLFYQLCQREAVLAFLRDIQEYTVEKRDQIDLFLARYRPDLSREDGEKLQAELSEMKKYVPRSEDYRDHTC